MLTTEIEVYWQAYLDALPDGKPRPTDYEAWSFGDNEKEALELATLVVQGRKTATCSMLWDYAPGERLPQTGDIGLITDADGHPMCIIETTEVTISPYNEVDAAHAYEEGEGDRSLEYWRRVHWQVYERRCPALGKTPDPSMPLVCERFRLLYSGPARPSRS